MSIVVLGILLAGLWMVAAVLCLADTESAGMAAERALAFPEVLDEVAQPLG